MNTENSTGNQEHRERGRGRKAFWIVIGGALLFGAVLATWSPRHERFGVEIWSALTPEQRAEVLRHWSAGRLVANDQ